MSLQPERNNVTVCQPCMFRHVLFSLSLSHLKHKAHINTYSLQVCHSSSLEHTRFHKGLLLCEHFCPAKLASRRGSGDSVETLRDGGWMRGMQRKKGFKESISMLCAKLRNINAAHGWHSSVI